MTKTIAIALVAALGFAGAASAGNASLTASGQHVLDEFGFDVDANTLSTAQLARLAAVDSNGGEDSQGQIRAQIRSAIK